MSPTDMDKTRDFIRRLVSMKDEAGRLGLFKTMHAMDEATRAVGYEFADKIAPGDSGNAVAGTRGVRGPGGEPQ